MKKIFIFCFILFILISSYYLGSIKFLDRFKNSQEKKMVTYVTPTITSYPVIDVFNNLKESNNGYAKYEDEKIHVSFEFPQNLTINGTPCYITLEKFAPFPHSSMWSYISIYIQKKNDNSICYTNSGLYENKPLLDPYDFKNSIFNKITSLKVGESISTSKDIPEYFTYKRLVDEIIGDNKVKHYISSLVWESSKNTVEHVYQINNEKYIAWINGFINEDLTQPDSIPFQTLSHILSTFHFD